MKKVLLVPVTLTDEQSIAELEAFLVKTPEEAEYWMVGADGSRSRMIPEASFDLSLCWTRPDEALPITDDIVLVSISGKLGHITLDHALEFASYDKDGWLLETFPEADPEEFTIHAWMVLPQAYGAEDRNE